MIGIEIVTKHDQLIRDRARAAVKRALARGQITRPSSCPRCNSPERFGNDGRSLMHAHHFLGYNHPLEIEWLCITCHFIEDKRPAKELNGMAKLDCGIVQQIRKRYQPGKNRYYNHDSAKSLAREFGVSDRTVGRIIRNEIWIDAALNPPAQKEE